MCNIHRKTSVLESLFNKAAGLQACNFTKKRLQHRSFSVSIAKFLRTPILKYIYVADWIKYVKSRLFFYLLQIFSTHSFYYPHAFMWTMISSLYIFISHSPLTRDTLHCHEMEISYFWSKQWLFLHKLTQRSVSYWS